MQLGEGSVSGQVFNFNNGLQIRVNNLHALKGTVNIYGTYLCKIQEHHLLFSHQVELWLSALNNFRIFWLRYFFIDYNGKLILESQAYNYTMAKVNLDYLVSFRTLMS